MKDIESIRLPVDHVSDTAWLVAEMRAMETERADAHFSDPYARRLVGTKGREIMDRLPEAFRDEWMLSVRTKAIDEIILRAVDEGVDTVVNLAAGLDARPYRLAVPETLRWIEADYPAVVQYKASVLAYDKPVCQLTRIPTDLSKVTERALLWDRALGDAKKALVLTEGLLMYLNEGDVKGLSNELLDAQAVIYWLMDLVSPDFLNFTKDLMADVPAGNTSFHFAPIGGASYFTQLGWEIAEFRSFAEETQRLARVPKGPFWNPEKLMDSGVTLLKKRVGTA